MKKYLEVIYAIYLRFKYGKQSVTGAFTKHNALCGLNIFGLFLFISQSYDYYYYPNSMYWEARFRLWHPFTWIYILIGIFCVGFNNFDMSDIIPKKSDDAKSFVDAELGYLICDTCGKNNAKKRSMSTGYDLRIICEKCQKDFYSNEFDDFDE